ncbi:bifunctional proline dehydrogenase/L-glutamate gamma-semialdehyde dehydrogenase PutA [Xanthobacter sp. V2C-8]|uniref:bifunctional proline dehydrogenase/L-glutamate gamma-semialdehyde dehydrogenase PutA n=1 Tax=Xanthobacter albus TaxID=3119929 RepID=UPI00372CCB5D
MTADTSRSAQRAEAPVPFSDFAGPVPPRSALRRAVTAATRRPEPECLAPLLQAATLPSGLRTEIAATAVHLARALRARPRGAMVDELLREFPLSSPEGAALMGLAEALLRIPDPATRDALIRDALGRGDWRAHLRRREGRSLLAGATMRGLAAAGVLARAEHAEGFPAALARLAGRCAAPLVRAVLALAVRRMGERFVMGETIEDALARARGPEARGFLYSYDMLGEAAVTAGDAERYHHAYEEAIHAIGKAAAGRGAYAGPGISIKLSALHPRYGRAQAGRVMAELVPRLSALSALAKGYGIGLTIDAEEQDRLELSLDVLEALCANPALAGWNGLGLAVQAYGRRSPFVLDWVVDLARRGGRRIMVRLVKGAYWDTEIKRAQVDGLADFPVFTRKAHADVSYIACARRLLAARDAVFPQFATHNAQTVASIHHLAGGQFSPGSYEFQCLHGMGEPLYEAVVGAGGLNRPCRIYAPVGGHATLLAYLARRLLENGANSSFVHRLADLSVPVEELAADPAAAVRAMAEPGALHPRIALPGGLFADRPNSAGLDLSDEDVLEHLSEALAAGTARSWSAAPPSGAGPARPVPDPADGRNVVGMVSECGPGEVEAAMGRAAAAAPGWAGAPVARRVAPLRAAADEMQARMGELTGLMMREAGKSAADAIAEVREAVDFLRYYACAAEGLRADQRGLGPMVCISPWNFPLSIFTGQVAAALAAGNSVLAKPAEETPLIAAEAVRILHRAGVPQDVLQLLPGEGAVGAALVAAPQVAGVLFTGSTQVARLIQASLAGRLSPEGRPLPLIAETGGQNAMVVDSSALPEQVVADVISSAFDSAGQRCSALRVLCLQEEVADHILALIRGTMAELRVAPTGRLCADVGPVIRPAAREAIEAHVARMAARGHKVHRAPLPPEAAHGTFVAPALIEIAALAELEGEVFGPVLHVLRYRRRDLRRVIEAVNATGYGLTFGLHTRLDSTIADVTARVRAGNIYVNRNIIGAVVGVQPFGGHGLSGTGPKAGGPLYLQRLVRGAPGLPVANAGEKPDGAALAFAGWLEAQGLAGLAHRARGWAAMAPLGVAATLSGPVGESNRYALVPRGRVLVSAETRGSLLTLAAAALATGNHVVAEVPGDLAELSSAWRRTLPRAVRRRMSWIRAGEDAGPVDAALAEGDAVRISVLSRRLVAREGPLVPLHTVSFEEEAEVPLAWLTREVSTSVNTTAAGGNATLMATA